MHGAKKGCGPVVKPLRDWWFYHSKVGGKATQGLVDLPLKVGGKATQRLVVLPLKVGGKATQGLVVLPLEGWW